MFNPETFVRSPKEYGQVFLFKCSYHSEFIADLYDQYLVNPDTVEASWIGSFFQGYDLANENYIDRWRRNCC